MGESMLSSMPNRLFADTEQAEAARAHTVTVRGAAYMPVHYANGGEQARRRERLGPSPYAKAF